MPINSNGQVDIAPTLALLYGVPIPKNNVGVVISGTFDSSTGQISLSIVHACIAVYCKNILRIGNMEESMNKIFLYIIQYELGNSTRSIDLSFII